MVCVFISDYEFKYEHLGKSRDKSVSDFIDNYDQCNHVCYKINQQFQNFFYQILFKYSGEINESD